jgi:hypothetical protein
MDEDEVTEYWICRHVVWLNDLEGGRRQKSSKAMTTTNECTPVKISMASGGPILAFQIQPYQNLTSDLTAGSMVLESDENFPSPSRSL